MKRNWRVSPKTQARRRKELNFLVRNENYVRCDPELTMRRKWRVSHTRRQYIPSWIFLTEMKTNFEVTNYGPELKGLYLCPHQDFGHMNLQPRKEFFFGENREYKINVWYINTAELATGNGQQKENTEKRPEFADAQWGTEGLTLVESIKRIESYAENRGGQW